jgi:hypothetical protein
VAIRFAKKILSFHVTVMKSEDFVTAQIDRYDNKKKQKHKS